MKIKKTYTRSRVGLFVGLLSFHTLSSCVNIGRELGMGLCQSKEKRAMQKLEKECEKQNQEIGIGNYTSPFVKRTWYNSNKRAIWGGVIGVTVLTASSLAAWYYLLSSGGMEDPIPITTIPPDIGDEKTAVGTTPGPLEVW